MDLEAKLTENKRQFKSGEISEDEFEKRKKLILEEWLSKSKEIKQPEYSRGKCHLPCYSM